MKVERTTYLVDGCKEPCIIVSSDDGFVKVRISKMYHYIGNDTLYLVELIGDAYNSSEEWEGDFDLLTDKEAIALARKFSIYL